MSMSLTVKDNTTMKDDCLEWWCGETSALIILEVIVLVLCILGSFGNILTVLAIILSSLRYNINCILIGSLSFAGFLYCSFILGMQALILHSHSQSVSDIFCSAAGGIRYTLVGVIMIHLGVIALYRFLNVVHLNKYRFLSKSRQLSIALAICWLLPLVFTIPPTFRLWGGFQFQPSILACTFDKSIEQSNRIVTVTAGFIVPCIFIIYCYVRIGLVAQRSFKRMSRWKGNTPQGKALKVSAMMLCIFVIFFLGTFPYFILNVSDTGYKYPIHHVWTTMLGWLLYCLNPFVYTMMDQNFRKAFKRILTCDCEKNPARRSGSMFTGVTASPQNKTSEC